MLYSVKQFTPCETLFLGQTENIFIFNQAKHKEIGKKISSKHFTLKEMLFEFYFIFSNKNCA